jgi:excisionase family DNA binding protein
MKPRRLGPFLTVEEVAEILRTTPQALYMMRHRGQGPPSVKVGRKLLYAQSDVETYIDHLYSQQEIATEPFRVTIGGSA